MTDEQTPTAPERPERKPFAMALQEMRKGGLHTEMSDELADLVKRCVEVGKKGTIALTLTVSPHSDGQTVSITDKIVVKAPRFDAASTIYWPDEHGNLLRNRPDQPELPLREISGGKEVTIDENGEVKPLREAGS